MFAVTKTDARDNAFLRPMRGAQREILMPALCRLSPSSKEAGFQLDLTRGQEGNLKRDQGLDPTVCRRLPFRLVGAELRKT